MDDLRTQVGVAPLADAEQLGLASGRMLPRRQTEPRREIPASGERRSVANGGNEGGGVDDTDARNGGQPPCLVVHPCELRKLVVIRLDPTIQLRPLVA